MGAWNKDIEVGELLLFCVLKVSTFLYNIKSCDKDFPAFAAMHGKAINALKASTQHLPSSMGIKKTA